MPTLVLSVAYADPPVPALKYGLARHNWGDQGRSTDRDWETLWSRARPRLAVALEQIAAGNVPQEAQEIVFP